MPPLSALRAFAVIAVVGNVSRADAELNIIHAAISQQIRSLYAAPEPIFAHLITMARTRGMVACFVCGAKSGGRLSRAQCIAGHVASAQAAAGVFGRFLGHPEEMGVKTARALYHFSQRSIQRFHLR